ncbi:hypothetical protein BU24DRAFT_86868 [Aaosphaeria arxii CBS 175.79]|uniref:Secreted protein n=1 Tax=Aaosphaeria arxii CBS 175.79 TaxID=1450172 RepID=A0A6A5X8Q7_9PLEO|nr:uncharacterized protein BU24DRAFT_86868 [Aaosphaeria arxii CBS 175.79]KAF2009301.1 hypothetical protein BU24DRAFT_86868 [Aaosphaeria arxii CBS 175.79]
MRHPRGSLYFVVSFRLLLYVIQQQPFGIFTYVSMNIRQYHFPSTHTWTFPTKATITLAFNTRALDFADAVAIEDIHK